MNRRLAAIWSYFLVAVCTAIWYWLIVLVYGTASIEANAVPILQDARPLNVALLAGVVALFVFYLNLTKSSFGEWLEYVGAATTYLFGYIWAMLIGVAANGVCIIVAHHPSGPMIHAALVLMLWLVITFFATATNSWMILRLRNTFQREVRKEDEAAGATPFKSQD